MSDNQTNVGLPAGSGEPAVSPPDPTVVPEEDRNVASAADAHEAHEAHLAHLAQLAKEAQAAHNAHVAHLEHDAHVAAQEHAAGAGGSGSHEQRIEDALAFFTKAGWSR